MFKLSDLVQGLPAAATFHPAGSATHAHIQTTTKMKKKQSRTMKMRCAQPLLLFIHDGIVRNLSRKGYSVGSCGPLFRRDDLGEIASRFMSPVAGMRFAVYVPANVVLMAAERLETTEN